MEDLEAIIPFLREFLNERGLKDVNFTLVIDKLSNDVVNKTYPNKVAKVETLYSNRVYLEKKVQTDKDTIILQTKLFNK